MSTGGANPVGGQDIELLGRWGDERRNQQCGPVGLRAAMGVRYRAAMAPDANDLNREDRAMQALALSNELSLAAAIDEKVSLHAHDPAWAVAFAQERDRLHALVPAAFVAIEHIGSTAVPGLVARPIIDMLAAVESLDGVDALIERLCAHGYATSMDFNASLTDRKWLMRWRDGHRTHHLHIVVAESAPWRDRLHFRDALRSQPALARRYARLKAELAVRHRFDREAYTDAKSAFVRDALLECRQANMRPPSQG